MKIAKKQREKSVAFAETARRRCRERLNDWKAILYAVENGCERRAPPRRYTVYRRFRRRAENGVLSRVMELLQSEGFIGADFSVLSLGSTLVKSSSSAAALKNGPQAIERTKGSQQLATKVRAIVPVRRRRSR